jgi:hypothetical protein
VAIGYRYRKPLERWGSFRIACDEKAIARSRSSNAS